MFDYNQVSPQNDFDVIPAQTIARVRLNIKRGNYDDPQRGLTGGWATISDGGAIYLNGDFVVVSGPYKNRHVYTLIGLHSPKGDKWANMGKEFIRAMLDSAHGLAPKDTSSEAIAKRRITDFGQLNGLEFCALIGVDQDQNGEPRNLIRKPLSVHHKSYAETMNDMPSVTPEQYAQASGGYAHAFDDTIPF